LPLGLFYLKITADDYIYYSDYLMIDNIYENLISSWSDMGGGYDLESFFSYGSRISVFENTVGSGACVSNSFYVRKGEVINAVFYVQLYQNQLPDLLLTNSDWSKSTGQTLVNGLNHIQLTATWSGTSYLRIYANSKSSYVTIPEVFVFRQYSPKFCKIKFTNTNNVGNLLYADDFYQEVWLEAVLNNPTSEFSEIGEEKDGVFIPEKIVSKYNYAIIAYVSRAMYSCLSRLRQHDSITITDECGEIYTPGAGNITVEQPEWTYYDTAKVTIKFNNDEDSQYVWTK
jgi:hypothetical protein